MNRHESPEEKLVRLGMREVPPSSSADDHGVGPPPTHVSLNDFWAYMVQHNYIFAPTGELWPGASVNARIPPISVGTNEEGKPMMIPARVWLDQRSRSNK